MYSTIHSKMVHYSQLTKGWLVLWVDDIPNRRTL